MPDLHERLTAAVNARLEVAREACLGRDGAWHQGGRGGWLIEDDEGDPVVHDEGFPTEQQAVHIAANDPATVIRHCERDLRVLERHASSGEGTCRTCCGESYLEEFYDDATEQETVEELRADLLYPCDEIRDLAMAYGMEVPE